MFETMNFGQAATMRARALFEAAFAEMLDGNVSEIDDFSYEVAIDLALVLSKTGEQDRAAMLLDRSLATIRTIPRLGASGYGIADVKIHALQGNTSAALAALREAVDQGWRNAWWFSLGLDPSLDSIRDEPEFQTIVDEIKADMAAQLERVRAMDANGELAPIPDIT